MPVKPSENEEKFFREHELAQRLQKAAQQQHAVTKDEQRRLRELHWMHCPKCGNQLAAELYGKVEVDVCPSCKGLWLDANELEMILESKTPFKSFVKLLGGK